MSKMYEARTVRTKSLGNNQQTLKAHAMQVHKLGTTPSKEVVQFRKDDMFKITIEKTKGQKRTSPIASFSPGQKVERKRSTTDNSEPRQNWGNFFRQQTLLYMTKKPCTCKQNEEREIKKNINVQKQQKSTAKYPIKAEETIPYCSSILVQDCAVQCSETYDIPKLVEFNRIHMLCLVKQLQNLVNKKDKKTCEIFTEMEQILQETPDQKIESNRIQIESNTTLLKESSKKMKAMLNESFIEKLQSEILQRDEQLKEADQKYSELKFHAKMLAEQLDQAIREKNDLMSMVSDLKRQIENNERIITDLKTELNKQTELVHKKNIDSKYLTMEIDKLSTLSSYKDTQIINYRNTIRELQNQNAKQLKTVNEMRMKERSISPQLSLIHTRRACSSSTSSFSHGSNKSWRLLDLSEISSVDSVSGEHAVKRDATIKHFVSLLDGESSHTIMPDQNEVSKTNDKGSAMQNNNENNTVSYQNVDTNDVTAKKFLHHASKGHNKKNDIYKTKKLRLKEKQNDNTKNLFLNVSKALESITSTKSLVSDIKKQGDMQNKKPVNVPSPLRDCPYPNWSDSSLLSISTVSNLDTVPSNNV